MKRTVVLICLLCLATGAALAELSEKIQKKLDTAESAYQAAVSKADNARFYAVQKASADRLKVLKQVLTEATKAGDFEGASKLQELVKAAEAGGIRSKPKQVVKFDGHEYALIEEVAPWHVAKRICEEMGGHLVTMETPAEVAGVAALCKDANATAWIGATDEDTEGKWVWISGKPVEFAFAQQNHLGIEHAMIYYAVSGRWEDAACGNRNKFVCEWEK